jgi:hypothetical protein
MRNQTLLARNYRGDLPMSAVEKFPVLLSEAEEESSAVPPCFSHEGINVSAYPAPAYLPTRGLTLCSISTSDTTTFISLRSRNETRTLPRSSSSYTR